MLRNSINMLSSTILKYSIGEIGVSDLSAALQQLYWNIDFSDQSAKDRFFQAFFEIEQVVASHINHLDKLEPRELEIIGRSIDVLSTFCKPGEAEEVKTR